VGLQVDAAVGQVGALGDPGQGDRENPVPARAQRIGEIVEAPCAVAGAGIRT
jgi:hypothetical protein